MITHFEVDRVLDTLDEPHVSDEEWNDDLGIYGNSAREQAEGLRLEREEKRWRQSLQSKT